MSDVSDGDAAAEWPAPLAGQAAAPAESVPVPETPAPTPEPTPEIEIEAAPAEPEPPKPPAPAETPAPEPVPAPPPPQPILDTSIKSRLSQAFEALRFKKRAKLDKILVLAAKKKSIKNDDVEKFLKVSDSTAQRYLNQLVSEGKLRRSGTTAGISYESLTRGSGQTAPFDPTEKR